MSLQPVVSRFAPSPTGEMHLGNARTALFSALAARRSGEGGRFLLRIEDTDVARSTAAFAEGLLEDLRWLGLHWDGAVVHQSARGAAYDQALATLVAAGSAYPCFCTVQQLEQDRDADVAAGRPPRYAGHCRDLPSAAAAARLAAGEPAAMRFRVPAVGDVAFDDIVHGAMRFLCEDIGDFVLRRADGGSAFFFTNAVDDAASGVNLVLRGEDHLSNTPRQLLLLQGLRLPAPRFGHVSLLMDADGKPLSKRRGAASLRQLRATGYLPEAICNLLFRVGHHTDARELLDMAGMTGAFDLSRLQAAAARVDPGQLHSWQKRAAQALDPGRRESWLGGVFPAGLDARWRTQFIAAIAPNLVLPSDALPWLQVALEELPQPAADAAAALAAAPAVLFRAALDAYSPQATFRELSTAAAAATGLKGPALFKPLRAALTARLDGPDLAALLPLIAPALVRSRLGRFA